MNVAALVVSVVAAVAAVVAVWYARRSDRSAARSAAVAERAEVLDKERRHAELTPRLRVTYRPSDEVRDDRGLLSVLLAGPVDLGYLDSITVRIRDDSAQGGSNTFEFVPKRRNLPGWAESADQVTVSGGVPVGEWLEFSVDPSGVAVRLAAGLRPEQVKVLRLEFVCRLEDQEPWSLSCEIDTASLPVTVEVP